MTTATIENTTAAAADVDAAEASEPKINTVTDEQFAFHAAVKKVIDNPDAAKDDKSDEIVAIRRAYGALSKDERRSVKLWLKETSQTLVDEGVEKDDMSKVKSGNAVVIITRTALKPLAPVSSITGSTATPADPTDAFVELKSTVYLAYAVVEATKGESVDESEAEKVQALVTSEAQTRAVAYRAWIEGGMEGEEPEATNLEKAAARISLGRSPKGQGRKPGGKNKAADADAAPADADAAPADADAVAAE